MKKIFLIGIKDIKIAFRDRAALILMLLAPFVLTVGLGFVAGRFSGNDNNGIGGIPVLLVNQDGGQLGVALVDLFSSDELSDLIQASETDNLKAAKRLIDEDQGAAVVLIPYGFTGSCCSSSRMGTRFGTP